MAIVIFAAILARVLWIPSDPAAAVTSAEQRYHYDIGDPPASFSAWALGDGQAFVMIALDPTGGKLAEELTQVAFRFMRAGYGWATWAFSLGQAELIPYGLFVVGSLAVIGALIVAINLRARLGPRSWFIVLNPSLFIGFAGDTAEPLGILLLTLALASGSALAAAALGVTRPTFLIAMMGRWRGLVVGVVATAILIIYVVIRFGVGALAQPGGALSPPGVAYIEQASPLVGLLGLVALWTVVRGIQAKDLSWLVSGAFVLCMGSTVLANPENAWRAAGLLTVLWAFGPNYLPRAEPGRQLAMPPSRSRVSGA